MQASLCLQDLAETIGGVVRLGDSPPLHGLWTKVGRIVFDCRRVRRGDVFWQLRDLARSELSAEQAFLRGACGIITDDPAREPWPGKFCLVVGESTQALLRLEEWLEAAGNNLQELKDLQLPAPLAPDITLATCGRPLPGESSRCQRRAA